ncbi:NUDIX family hydrolase [Nitzschia inconspicua]|uniref:NUDIX family hydrolase n=1 Tax=Nitzschia inconspicua TaxID=303405 RepID=A0A9K3PW85_9STRA|nr:NUDIX family hydrolase [Nitzschia inconspicua]
MWKVVSSFSNTTILHTKNGIGRGERRRCLHLLTKKSSPFYRLVLGLKEQGKTLTVVESCCGGLINAGIMSIPGSSSIYHGGSVAYNTERAKPFLLNDDNLHQQLLDYYKGGKSSFSSFSDAEAYVESKKYWTAQTAKSFCEQTGVDYAIAEGGASGPTFRPNDLTEGFVVLAIAGRDAETGKVQILAQTVVRSQHANRQENMRLFADSAAQLAVDTIFGSNNKTDTVSEKSNQAQAGLWLDRATHLRTDPEALQRLEQSFEARCVVLSESIECLMKTFDGGTRNELVLLPLKLVPNELPRTFLGLDPQQHPVFTVDITKDQWGDIQGLSSASEVTSGLNFENTRTHAPLLPVHENELALYATALSQWKRTHQFCSICGGTLHGIQGGTCLKCSSCSNMSWPRQDPSIIVLVTNRSGDKALLARSPRHGPKLHTALAGFVEAGETFEQAVMRETFEETGIQVDPDSISYLSSQPWPFPRSCMIAFRATADDENQEITIDPNEIVSAHWFDKSQVTKAATVQGAVMNKDVAAKALETDPSLNVLVPPKGVVARALIDDWLEDA